MNRCISYLACLGTLVVGQVNVEVPLRRAADDNFFATVSIPTAGVRYVAMKLSLGNTNTISHPSAIVGEPSQTLILNSGSSSPSYNFTDPDALIDARSGNSYLTIGPDSELTRTSGAVAIIRNNDDDSAKLIVGSTLQHFDSFCRPNSTVRLLIDESDLHFESGFTFGAYTVSNTRLRFEYTLNRILFSAPASLVQNISRAIQANGGVPQAYSGTIYNCNQTTIASLPDIRITIGQRGRPFGTLAYYPEDYIDLADGNRCTLRVRAVSGVDRFIINPLVLPYTNFRISSHTWELCDAADPTA